MKVAILQTIDSSRDQSKSLFAVDTLESLLQKETQIVSIDIHSSPLVASSLKEIFQVLSKQSDLIISIGGTGLGPDDYVPEVCKKLYHRE
ncbi:molybdopterin-binding protein [bacterium]|nr:molybdopterin-binding protein [bacterium]